MHYYFTPIEKYSNELVVAHNGMTRLPEGFFLNVLILMRVALEMFTHICILCSIEYFCKFGHGDILLPFMLWYIYN